MRIKRKFKAQHFNMIEFLIALDAIFSMSPYILWETYSNYKVFDVIKMFIEIIICLLYFKNHQKRIYKSAIVMCITFLFMYTYYVLDAYPGTLFVGLGTIMKAIIIVIFILQPREGKGNIFRIFSVLFAFSLLPGIVYCVLNILHITLPVGYIESVSEIKQANAQHYLHYFGAVFRENIYYSPIFKQVCAIYDEPGIVGTISAFILFANNYDIKKNKHLILVILGGILSMSFAFYVISLVAFLLMLISRKKIKRKYFFVGVFFAIILIFAFNNPIFQQFVFQRFKLVNLINNNRTSSQFDLLYNDFIATGFSDGSIFFGLGNGNPIYHSVDVSSYKVIIYNLGLVGFLLIIGWYLGWGLRYSGGSRLSKIYLFIFMLSIYQRPWIIYLYYIVILFGGIENLKSIEHISNDSRLIQNVAIEKEGYN